MVTIYLRILVYFSIFPLLYIAFIYVSPSSGQKIDTKFHTSFNHILNLKTESFLEKVNNTKSIILEKIDNPAPNASKAIRERMGKK